MFYVVLHLLCCFWAISGFSGKTHKPWFIFTVLSPALVLNITPYRWHHFFVGEISHFLEDLCIFFCTQFSEVSLGSGLSCSGSPPFAIVTWESAGFHLSQTLQQLILQITSSFLVKCVSISELSCCDVWMDLDENLQSHSWEPSQVESSLFLHHKHVSKDSQRTSLYFDKMMQCSMQHGKPTRKPNKTWDSEQHGGKTKHAYLT